MIKLECPNCHKRYKLSDELSGAKVKCRKCGTRIQVPEVEFSGDQRLSSPVAQSKHVPRRQSRSKKPKSEKSRSEKGSSESSHVRWLVVLGMAATGFSAVFSILDEKGPPVVQQIEPVHREVPRPNFDQHFGKDLGPQNAQGSAIEEVLADSNERPLKDMAPVVFDVALPTFPELGSPIETFPSGVRLHAIEFSSIPSNGRGPGMQMAMRVYVPPGNHSDRTLPCVLVAPAGTNLFVGMKMDFDDYHVETLPYAEAGMVCIFYGLDGHKDNSNRSTRKLGNSYKEFRAARAGLVNGRFALEFALTKLPAVNPEWIVSAGHSSAGTLSLLMGAHEPRLAACVAYCPAINLKKRLAGVANTLGNSSYFPGFNEFVAFSSPHSYMIEFDCPLFLFGVRDDGNSSFAEIANFSHTLNDSGGDVTLESVAKGGHYQPMLDDGVPMAIDWLQKRFQLD